MTGNGKWTKMTKKTEDEYGRSKIPGLFSMSKEDIETRTEAALLAEANAKKAKKPSDGGKKVVRFAESVQIQSYDEQETDAIERQGNDPEKPATKISRFKAARMGTIKSSKEQESQNDAIPRKARGPVADIIERQDDFAVGESVGQQPEGAQGREQGLDAFVGEAQAGDAGPGESGDGSGDGGDRGGAAAGSWLIFWTPSRRRLAVKPTCRSAGRFASPLPMPKSPGSLMTVSVRSALPSL